MLANRQDPNEVTLDQIATKAVTTVTPDTDLAEARGLMEQRRIRRLPVVKRGELVGMLSLGDVAVALSSKRQVGEALQEISVSASTESVNDGPAIGRP